MVSETSEKSLEAQLDEYVLENLKLRAEIFRLKKDKKILCTDIVLFQEETKEANHEVEALRAKAKLFRDKANTLHLRLAAAVEELKELKHLKWIYTDGIGKLIGDILVLQDKTGKAKFMDIIKREHQKLRDSIPKGEPRNSFSVVVGKPRDNGDERGRAFTVGMEDRYDEDSWP